MQAQIGTKDTNNRKMGQNVVPSASMASVSDSNISIAAASGGASDSAVGTSSAVVSPDAVAVTTADPPTVVTSNTMPSGKFAQLKSIRVKDTRDAKAKRNEWRITKMVLAIFLSFVCCYLPITVTKVADKDVQYPAFHIFGYIMLYLSSCINPIIYVIMNKQYRQAYKTVILCQPARLLAFTHGGSSVGGKTRKHAHTTNFNSVSVHSTHVCSWHFLFDSRRTMIYLEMRFRFREIERHRIQLQSQSYHGLAGVHCRGLILPESTAVPTR